MKYTWGVFALFVLVVGGLYVGVFMPTEAAGVGAFLPTLVAFPQISLSLLKLTG